MEACTGPLLSGDGTDSPTWRAGPETRRDKSVSLRRRLEMIVGLSNRPGLRHGNRASMWKNEQLTCQNQCTQANSFDYESTAVRTRQCLQTFEMAERSRK